MYHILMKDLAVLSFSIGIEVKQTLEFVSQTTNFQKCLGTLKKIEAPHISYDRKPV